jgi:hypothetical protein
MGQGADSTEGSETEADKATSPRLGDRVREAIRSRRYGRRTERTCGCRMRLFIWLLVL